MKKMLLATLVLGAIALGCKKETCDDKPGQLPCELIDCAINGGDPVCGCDGVTYNNTCHAECVEGITEYTEGACK